MGNISMDDTDVTSSRTQTMPRPCDGNSGAGIDLWAADSEQYAVHKEMSESSENSENSELSENSDFSDRHNNQQTNCKMKQYTTYKCTRGAWLAAFAATAAAALAATMASSCSVIDEDLSDCGVDYSLDYNVRLQTNMHTEIDNVLTSPAEQQVGRAMAAELAHVFTDVARDVDLAFYSAGAMAHRESHVVNAGQSSFTIYLPQQDYMHLATANLTTEQEVTTTGIGGEHTMTISQPAADTIGSHSIGIFTARREMKVENRNQTFHVDLYMVNSAAALVADTAGVQVERMQMYASGFATDFHVADSIYTATSQPVVRTNEVVVPNSKYLCRYGVTMPSGKGETRTGAACGWKLHVYVTLATGKTTETILTIPEELKAGQLKIIKGKVDGNGGIVPDADNVGVSVTLDWKPGGVYEPDV